MKPAPMTTTFAVPSAILARRASESSSVRSSWTFAQRLLAGQAARHRPRGEDQPVERHDGAVGELDGASVDVERGGRHTEAQVEAERVDVVGLAQGDAVGLPLAGEQLLRQRRPVVGQVLLGADQRDPAR